MSPVIEFFIFKSNQHLVTGKDKNTYSNSLSVRNGNVGDKVQFSRLNLGPQQKKQLKKQLRKGSQVTGNVVKNKYFQSIGGTIGAIALSWLTCAKAPDIQPVIVNLTDRNSPAEVKKAEIDERVEHAPLERDKDIAEETLGGSVITGVLGLWDMCALGVKKLLEDDENPEKS